VRLRVLTYNIRCGTDMLGRPRLNEQAVVMRQTAADLVLLQEVNSSAQAEHLGSLVKLPHVAFGAARTTRDGEFGNALLCRWPFEQIENHVVPAGWPLSQARAVLAATVIADGRRIQAIVAHFGLLPGEPELSAHVVVSLAAARNGALIVGGDLNRPLTRAACHRLLRGVLVDSAAAHGRVAEPTFPALRPFLRLDYVYVRDLVVQEVRAIPSSASDHRPLVADLWT
jgi:endonuclease/exonuclease/phosphatase family metal-dependent hydrolase